MDGIHLLSAMLKREHGQAARDVLVANARLRNSVATSFLKIDKEIGLVQYWGFVGYLREKQIGASWHPTAKRLLYGSSASNGGKNGGDNDPDEPKTKDKKQVARVAFMITSTQRAELSERLGYDADHIKQLNPVEASLILRHNVSPEDVNDRLAGLVQDYNEQQAQLHQEAKWEAERVARQRLETVEQEVEGNQVFLEEEFSATESAATAKLWYEVVETRVADGSAIPVALYKDEDEAKLCLELKEGFADRRAREKNEKLSTTYTIRKTVK